MQKMEMINGIVEPVSEPEPFNQDKLNELSEGLKDNEHVEIFNAENIEKRMQIWNKHKAKRKHKKKIAKSSKRNNRKRK
jgi:hypothetical protein